MFRGWQQRWRHFHRWLGSWLAALLLLIIFTGSLSFYRAELDRLQLPSAAQHLLKTSVMNKGQTAAESAAVAQRFLASHAANAQQWFIELPSERKPYLMVHWQTAEGQLWQQWLHANTGEPLTTARQIRFGATEHQLGGLFFQLHYNLLHVAGPASRSIVAFAALLWLLLSLAGVFVVRWRELSSARQWHQRLGILTLPFALVFASTGWVTQMFSSNPAPQQALFANSAAFYQALFPPEAVLPATPATADAGQLPNFTALSGAIQQTEFLWQSPVGKMTLSDLGQSTQSLTLTRSSAAAISNQAQTRRFVAQQQQWQALNIQATPPPAPMAMARAWLYGLHQSLYAGPALRALLFLSGISCCLMILLALHKQARQLPPHGMGRWLGLLPLTLGLALPSAALLLICWHMLEVTVELLLPTQFGLILGACLLGWWGCLGWYVYKDVSLH